MEGKLDNYENKSKSSGTIILQSLSSDCNFNVIQRNVGKRMIHNDEK
jgi:hypothetical protein